MSTATMPTSVMTVAADDDIHHYYCCDVDVAECGQDITHHTFLDDAEVICPICAHIEDNGLPCPIPGCPYR